MSENHLAKVRHADCLNDFSNTQQILRNEKQKTSGLHYYV